MELKNYEFIKEIAKDYNLCPDKEIRGYFNKFPIFKGKRKISAFFNTIIVDRNGDKHPYMLSNSVRNEEKLEDFDYLLNVRSKTLEEITKEANIKLKSEKCKIDDGGGWYCNGTRYYYKQFKTEI